MRLRAARGRLIAAGVVACLAVGVFVALVTRSPGYSTRHVALNDGGIWATSDRDGLIGRANLPAGSLDAAFAPPGGAQQNYQLDVLQDRAGVVARDRANGKLYPVDVAAGAVLPDAGIALSADDQLALDGGTLAVLDPSNGKVWAIRFDPGKGLANLVGIGAKNRPVATLDASGDSALALAVGVDGTVRAVSATGRVAVVRPSGGGFAKPQYTRMHAQLRAPQITAVGDQTVVFDAATGSLLVPGHRNATLPEKGASAEIQQPAPSGSRALIATRTSVYALRLSDGSVRKLSGAGSGAPTAPTSVGRCSYVAWTGNPGVVLRTCDGSRTTRVALANQKSLVQPSIRVNHGAAMLNDVVTGGLWNLQTGRRLDNWTKVKPPTTVKPKHDNNHPSRRTGTTPAPPHAVADTLGGRPGRTATLYVLDNDSDPSGNILSISGVSGDSGADLQIAPDGQTVQVAMPASGSAVHFRYTVNDGRGLSASAPVTVQPRPLPANRAPDLRRGFAPRLWPVAAGGRLSLPVLGDWRDFDGDPPILKSATASAGSVTTSPDGRLNYVAPLRTGTETLTYQVTDGLATSKATVQVEVLAPSSTRTTAPVAEPDVARGQVGQPIVIRPLDNDLPGADPSTPNAQLQLAADIANPDGTTVATNLKTGAVTLTAAHAGIFLFRYAAAYGNAPYGRGSVRVDVVTPPAKSAEPIAVLDTITLHGQRPNIVDVLQNDFDPAGRLLVVQSANPPNDSQLQVAIVQGRFLRVNALTPTLNPNPQVVNYVITDGVSAAVTGQVSVNQLPPPPNDTPVPQDDFATVRAADSVAVPVLDNDVDPSGDSLTLAQNVPGAPAKGQLKVTGTPAGEPTGSAYISGGVVRYAAPPSITSQRTVTIEYVVQNSTGDQAIGHAVVTIVPAPTPAHPDQAPTPPEVDGRAVAGDTVTVPIQSSGADPDGDSVTVVGVGSAPTLGRVLGFTASTVRYQAYPTSAGTDTFTYVVADRFGKTGTATIRIAVVPPGDPQPPVAADLVITAAPGSTVTSDVLSAAFTSPDDIVTILALNKTNAELPKGQAQLLSPRGPIKVVANRGLEPVVVRYAIQDGLGRPSYASLTVRSRTGIDLPPVAVDQFATPQAHHDVVTVSPLGKDYDPDGPADQLHVSRVFNTAATVAGDQITVPVRTSPQAVPYEITDAGGASAMAVIYIPAQGAGLPYAKAAVIQIGRNGSKTINIADYAVDPAGKRLSLTTAAQVSASPSAGLRASMSGTFGVTLTGLNGYAGPAAVTFQVTDGSSLTDPNGVTGIITVPVQVGPPTPVLRCPTNAIPVVEGGAALLLDITSLCHVWVADPATLDHIQYTAEWSTAPGNVDLGGFGSGRVRVEARGSARPGAVGVVKLGVSGSKPEPAQLRIVVVAAPPPQVSPVTVDGLVAGHSRTVDMADYVSSGLRDKVVTIVRVAQTAGMDSKFPTNASTITMTPGADAHGTITYAVTVSDVADRTRASRQATGQITLHVLGVPDAPSRVAPARAPQSHTVVLGWNAPRNNGEPIDRYDVSWGDGHRSCAGPPCAITGLTNGRPYRFTVRAHNAVGWSKPSALSPVAEPDAAPSAPTGLQTANPSDGRLTIAWQPAKVDGTPVLHYIVSWPGGRQVVTGLGTTATGLNNDAPTTFTIVAVNKAGPGPAARVTGQSSGTPQYPAPPARPGQLPAPHLSTNQHGDHQAVTVSWRSIDPNGPGPVTYTLTRTLSGGATTTVCTTNARSCTDADVTNDGLERSYSYTASNATKHTSAGSTPASFVARGQPSGVSRVTLTGTGQDGAAVLTFDENAVYDKAAIVHCRVNGGGSCGDFSFDGPGAHPGQKQTLSGLPGGSVTVTLQQCNTVATCADSQSATGTVYGDLDSPTITDEHASGPYVAFTVNWNPDGARVQVTVTVQGNGHNYQATLNPGDVDNSTHSQTFGINQDDGLNTPFLIGSDANATITATVGNDSPVDRQDPAPARSQVRTGQITVAVSRGADCAAGQPPACGKIHLTLGGFQPGAAVGCHLARVGGAPGPDPNPSDVSVATDGNGHYDGDPDSGPTYQDIGTDLQATCESIQSQPFTWKLN